MSDNKMFWAEKSADELVESGKNPVIKGGVSPSGIPHLGNFNEVLRGFFVKHQLEKKGVDVVQVFTRDDRDPLRKVPENLADSEGKIVTIDDSERSKLKKYVGRPYVDIPDPFGCCSSWADHFGNLLEESARKLQLDVDFISTDSLYSGGKMEDSVETVLSSLDKSRKILGRFQDLSSDYIPFMPICSSCGKITATPLSVDIDEKTVKYRCDRADLSGVKIEGCGNEDITSFNEGKLPWRFEWPAQWKALDVGFEPFGKDHLSSWNSGKAIAEEILDIKPPETLVYEFFLVDGEKMSASRGNVYTVPELLEMIEPEVLLYFFALDPSKQRDFKVEGLHHLVNEFDRLESIYTGQKEPADKHEELLSNIYPAFIQSSLEIEKIEDLENINRPPYTFAAMVGVSENKNAIIDTLKRSGHLPENPKDIEIDISINRVNLARNWARRLKNQYYIEIIEEPPNIDFDKPIQQALNHLSSYIQKGHTADEIQDKVFQTARKYDIDPSELFSAAYQLLLGQKSGPRLGPLITALDEEFVSNRLKIH